MFLRPEYGDYKRLCMAYVCQAKERLQNSYGEAFQYSNPVPERNVISRNDLKSMMILQPLLVSRKEGTLMSDPILSHVVNFSDDTESQIIGHFECQGPSHCTSARSSLLLLSKYLSSTS